MIRKGIDLFSRLFVGGLFIFSGLIKLNDPIGTKIKLEEYFEVFSSDFASFFEWFIPLALPLGMILIVLEVVLGVAVLINYKMPKITWVLLLLMVFFTFLTFYSAQFDKVTDCGCFGDAIPLTPWQSFYKDLILIVFVFHLFWYRKKYQAILRTRTGNAAIIGVTVICFIAGIYAINHLPYIDFRPYNVGASIQANMVADESPILEYTFLKDGEEVKSLKYYSPKEGYEFVSLNTINEKASTPKITDYQTFATDGSDFTGETFKGNKLIIVIYNVQANTDYIEGIRNLAQSLQGVEPIILTASGEADFENFRHEHQLAIPYYFTDATVLKAMIRSSPGLLLWKDGVVLGKWHYNDVPTAKKINEFIR